MQQKIFQNVFTTRSWGLWKGHRKGIVPKIVYIYIYIYKRKKKFLNVKSQAEVLAFGAYMFES